MKFRKIIYTSMLSALLFSTTILTSACGSSEPKGPVNNDILLETTPNVQAPTKQPETQKPQKETKPSSDTGKETTAENTTEKPDTKPTAGEKETTKSTAGEKETSKPKDEPVEVPTKRPDTDLPTAAPTQPDYEIPTVKPTEPPTAPTEEETTGTPYNPSTQIPEIPPAPAGSTNGTPNCAAQLYELTPTGFRNDLNKSFICATFEIGIKNNGSSTMRIFPYANVTVSNISGMERDLVLNNSNNIPVEYIDIPAGSTVYVRFRVLGEHTLFSTQKNDQVTTVHFSFYYGNTIYDATCSAGVSGLVCTPR